MNKTGIIFEYNNEFLKSYSLPIGDVVQVSEISVVKCGEIAEHTQICDEITYVVSGEATIISGNKQDKIKAGQIHYINKGLKHKIIVGENDNFRFICIGININMDYPQIEFLNDALRCNSFVIDDNGDIRVFSQCLLNEFYLNDKVSNLMINTYLTQIFVTLFRILKSKHENKKYCSYDKGSANFTIYHTLRYIDREYLQIKSVKQLAQKLSYSEYYISHLFKDKMGLSIKRYLLNKKISVAAELLLSSDLSVEKIAEYLNFSSAHTFYQAFKKLLKLSPTEYKKANFRR